MRFEVIKNKLNYHCLSIGTLLCSSGTSTVKTPSRDSEDLIKSGFVPSGNRNSLLYSRNTFLESEASSCLACTCER